MEAQERQGNDKLKFVGRTVYGPVKSWRVGLSLGIDLLYTDSICNFRCIYCQLGKINILTNERKVYVSTEQVLQDLEESDWERADIVTFSGSGEPTLAANLGEVIQRVKARTGKPILVLTNSVLLNNRRVVEELSLADKVFCKLDAVDEKTFKLINRPIPGITLETIVSNLKKFRQEYTGFLAIQFMLTRLNKHGIVELARLLKLITPDEVQLNTPQRPIPYTWTLEARAGLPQGWRTRMLKPVPTTEIKQIASTLAELTGLRIMSRES